MVTKLMIMADGSYALIRPSLPILFLSTKWRFAAVVEAMRFGLVENWETIKYFDNQQKEAGMKIKTILSQNRRDFHAIYECEHCGATKEGSGYDDDYFHRNVIPEMKCEKCGKVADKNYRQLTTKYAAHEVV